MTQYVFDRKSADQVTIPFKSPHKLFKDAQGHMVLYCSSTLEGGGVAINKQTLDWYRSIDDVARANKMVVLENKSSGILSRMPLHMLIIKRAIESRFGEIYIYDKEDLLPDMTSEIPDVL